MVGAAVNERANAVREQYGAAVQVYDQLTRSPWRTFKLAILRPIMGVLQGRTEKEQLAPPYNEFHGWGLILFDGGVMEQAFRDTWPDLWHGR